MSHSHDDAIARRQRDEVVRATGAWTAHNIELAPGTFTIGPEPSGEELKLRRITQLVYDLTGRPMDEARVLDLGALEGLYGIELAIAGAEVVFVEGREANAEKIRFALRSIGINRAEVITEDVRNIDPSIHGVFDAVLCLGLLYHLDAESILPFLSRLAELSRGPVVIDTHIALEDEDLAGTAPGLWIDPSLLSPIVSHELSGNVYAGREFREHDPASSPEQRIESRWASLDNPSSFWLTKPSLLNALVAAGFTSVLECHVPPLVGLPRDRITLVARAGKRRPLKTSTIRASADYERLPECSPPHTTHPDSDRSHATGPPVGARRTWRRWLSGRKAREKHGS